MSSAEGPRYRILRRLGQGGMAEVFEAEIVGELGFVRRVAIKRMLGDAAADESSARRFLDEARIASRLHHANVVSVTDVGLLDGLPFQVLELVDGINAQQLVQRAGGTLPLEIALIIAGQVAHALDHAHAAADAAGVPLGVVHRDVKPSNVLVSWGGDVKLADFGIAIARDRSAHTETGVVAGTRGFIAPEQRTRSEVDGRTDVFALGMTLHALIAGYTPLQDVTIEIAVLAGEPIPLEPTLPPDIRDLIARAVAPARLDRPSAGELANAIGAVLAPRLTRDARSRLREFLDGLETTPKRSTAGALDQLLGIEVILTAQPEGDVPRYHTVAPGRAARDGAISEPATRLARPAGPGAREAAGDPGSSALATAAARSPKGPRPRGSMIAIAVVAIVVLGVGGAGLWRLSSREAVATEPVPDAARGVALAVVSPDAAAPVAVEVAPPIDAAAVPDAPAIADPRRRPRRRDPISPRAKPDAGIVARPAQGTGWIQVFGEDLVGAKVLIDGGTYTVFVPNKLEIPFGTHRVEVERRDGTRLPEKTIELKSFHTMTSPARLTW